jgi:hypothetical protein
MFWLRDTIARLWDIRAKIMNLYKSIFYYCINCPLMVFLRYLYHSLCWNISVINYQWLSDICPPGSRLLPCECREDEKKISMDLWSKHFTLNQFSTELGQLSKNLLFFNNWECSIQSCHNFREQNSNINSTR